ncbi:uncharacterized protein LOC108627272 [Ceratina calcarata]|uniref:non-specific serine/threonine protein kinase n=1 Tax=Ceratina calcarata TaxID=156304 RepID=A0AAJ7J3Q3_9HYME|nr:uncharacterized protein LOC108627272 [Ceratina calcarata]
MFTHSIVNKMNRKLMQSVRTYERKKSKEVIIPLRRVDDSTFDSIRNVCVPLTKKSNAIDEESGNDNSVHDPFDTTFDRLLKNTRIPPKLPKTDNDSLSLDSTNSSVERRNKNSSQEKSYSFKVKSFSIGKKTRRKQKSVLTNIKTGKVKLQSTFGTLKVTKNKPQNKKNEKKTTSIILGIDSSGVSFEANISDAKKRNQKKRKNVAKRNNVKRRKKNNNSTNRIPPKYVETKRCSIHLDRLSVVEHSNKMNEVKKESDQLQQEVNQMNSSNLRHNDTSVKHCFVRLEHLEMDSCTNPSLGKESENNNSDTSIKHCFVQLEYLKENSFVRPRNAKSVHEMIISSTPIGRPLRSTTYRIHMSPILMSYSEKSKDNKDKSNNKYNISLESKSADSYIKLGTEMNEYKDKPRLYLSLTNTSVSSKSNSDRSENINEMNSVSSIICDQRNSMKNTSEREQNGISNSLMFTVKDEIIKTNQQCLRFSIDPNGSPSLFNDTSRQIRSPLNGNTETVLASNLKINNESPVDIEESDRNSNELSKNLSSSTTDKSPTIEKTQKELLGSSVAAPWTPFASFDSSIISLEINDKSKGADLIKQSALNGSMPLNVDTFGDSIERQSALSPCVVLKRLQDPIRITKRREYKKWNLDLDNIAEDYNDNTDLMNKVDEVGRKSKGRETILPEKLQALERESLGNTNGSDKSIYLKPGKSWARSITILNNVRNGSDLEKLSIGKGKKWRRSVQDILNMQKRGSIHSCIKKNASDKELLNEINNKPENEVTGKGRTPDSANVARVSRKISVRVVPIRKSVKSIEDAPFLEVYGIVPVRSQRFTLINNPRRSSGNVQIDHVDGQIIEEHPSLTAKEVILQRCVQKNYIPFSTYFTDSYLKHCQKIGEGVYGEVFLYEDEGKKSVIKIIPIEGNDYVNGEPQKKFHEILSEIVIAMELHNLRFNAKYNTDGFVEVKNIKCIMGKYPEKLIELWNIYDEEKCSDNDCPSMFRDDQLYIVLELGHGGQDLEAFVFNTADEAHILFIQAALALAVAEEAFEFEHRDLHWGNILISQTSEPSVHYKLGDKKIELISKGVKVSIIDFTLSRVTYQGCSIFNDLSSDPTLFTAQGEYQFEIYRLMRDKVKNNWHNFEPYTNILWLHYTLDKMIREVRYRKRNLKIHKNGIVKLKELKNEILSYNSAFDFVMNCDKVSNLLCIDTKSEVTLV